MRVIARIWIAGLAFVIAGVFASAAQASFGIERFFAGNCAVGHETCAEELVGPYSFPKEPSLAEAEEGAYTQAGGHVPFGVTHFKVITKGAPPTAAPEGIVTHIRTDVAPGVSTNPTVVSQCTIEQFGAAEAVPGTGFYPEPKCDPATKIGINKVVAFTGTSDVPIDGSVYNLVQPEGRSSDFGVALELPKALTEAVLNSIFHGTAPAIEKAQYFAHTFIEGGVEWGQQPNGTGAGDYHDYFEINVSPALPLISSRLVFFGRSGGAFVTNTTRCPGNTTTTLHLTDAEGTTVTKAYTPPLTLTGCNLVPFNPLFSLTPETKQSDEPNGVVTELKLTHETAPEQLDSSQLQNATIVLPEGMTLNPSAAQGLEACTPAQARIHSPVAGVACPAKSAIGSVSLEVPDLPPGSLSGKMYLGGPESGPITGPPYTIYIDAESARYGISTRLQGTATPNEATGRLTTTFLNNPEQPFSNLILRFTPGALAPIANPLSCGPAVTTASFVPYTGFPPSASPGVLPFTVDSNNAGGACASPLPFALSQSTEDHPNSGGSNANFTLNLTRPDGQQYLSKVSTTLPAGLVGKIPAVPLCGEPQATLGTCSSASQIGTATVKVGSGPTPIAFSGPVYLTGPYAGGPYGMTIVINAAVGPFSLGPVVTRAKITVDEFSGRVTVSSQLPTIVKGIPLRLKTLSVAINRQGFLINPTNCGVLATETQLLATFGASQFVSTPFQVSGCTALPFKPRLVAKTDSKATRHNGAMLEVSIGYPVGPQSNIKSVTVQLPKQLPSRTSTLKKACPEATFMANPYSCPTGSNVGGATAITPVLPKELTGRAFFVSHGGAAFPDLDLVMSGNGVSIILVGNTNISKGVTTTTFASVPDVPVTAFHLKLPYGKYSALAANGNLCSKPLIMPTTITAQSGNVIVHQNTRILVSNCGVQIVKRGVKGHDAVLKVKVFSAGRLVVSGRGLRTVRKQPRKAQTVSVSVPLSSAGLRALERRKPLNVIVRVSFIPNKGHSSGATAKVTFG
jgi:hypothetical protein